MLRTALAAQGITAQLVGADTVVALDSTAEAVGLAAAGAGAVVYELTQEQLDLEQIFLDLTTPNGGPR